MCMGPVLVNWILVWVHHGPDLLVKIFITIFIRYYLLFMQIYLFVSILFCLLSQINLCKIMI